MSSHDYHENEEQENGVSTEYTPTKAGEHKRRTGRKGFYAALAVCLAAVGVASWTSYDSVHRYQKTSAETVSILETSSAYSVAPAVSSSQPAASVAEQAASSAAPVVKKSVPAAAEVVTHLRSPMQGAPVQQAFSETPLYSKTMRDWRAHAGVDLRAPKGNQVTAAADGTVLEVSELTSWGRTVKLSHTGGLATWYCGLKDTAVQKGETVKAGQALGTLGEVPGEAAEAPHLHFAVQKNGVFIDPAPYLK